MLHSKERVKIFLILRQALYKLAKINGEIIKFGKSPSLSRLSRRDKSGISFCLIWGLEETTPSRIIFPGISGCNEHNLAHTREMRRGKEFLL
jgi:hypothetical protein